MSATNRSPKKATLPLRHAGHGDFLYLRGSIFYFRRIVPPALHKAFGKEAVSVSLRTAKLAEARHLLADHVRAFDIKAAKAGGRRDPTPPAPVAAIPDRDQMNAAVRAWLAETIQRSDPMATGRVPSDEDVSALSGQHRQSATHLQSSAVFGSPAGLATEWIAQAVADREGWALGDQSPEYRYLFNVVHAGQLEVASQVPELMGLRPVTVRNAALFGPELLAADKARPRASPALSDCLERYLVNPSLKANDKTRKQYRQRLTVLVEALGPSRPISSITREDCRKLRDDVLLRLPKNCSQRFPGMAVSDAIVEAERTGAEPLGSKTRGLMAEHLISFFDWAEKEDLITQNPARAISIALGSDGVVRLPFTVEHLTSIFSAPLYSGCVDDARNYAKVGMSRPRRHRFWIPIVALYSGMRLNEICQLQVADVIELGGSYFFDLRRYPATNRRLKNPQSARLVPIHDALIRIGILDYRRTVAKELWLFPLMDHDGHEGGSDTVSSWFGRFLDSVGVKEKGLVFHSFRHSFRDVLRDAGVEEERSFAIGGWKRASTGGGYGTGFAPDRLAEAMNCLVYRGFDLERYARAADATTGSGQPRDALN